MELYGVSLTEIRRRCANASCEADARTLAEALRRDARRGAQALADTLERRWRARRAEQERLDALFALRRRLFENGARWVAGVDEVGMGPLAGPVVAAAVVLRERVDLPGLNDSKRLSRVARERLDGAIREQALAVSLGAVAPDEIDARGIYRAGLEAMRRAVESLGRSPDRVLVDARTIPGIAAEQTPIVGGDRRDGTIAAASIVAKVHRDGLMRVLEDRYPGYGFAQHKGYPTPQHFDALRRLGPSPIHRRSFAPVARSGPR